ncbi:MAG: molybdopterin-binding protein [Azospirillaceae bacterium]|nr:molybdopterin-binding protein [Azospirillaceae bacterium]
MTTITASLIIIGNEILSGRTQDTNLASLAQRLNPIGIPLREVRVIADDQAMIVATVNELRARDRYVFTTGGIGPTHDDITAGSVAAAFGVPLVRDPDAVRLLESHYPSGHLNEARLRMATVPEGSRLIANPVSRAPGFQIGNVFVLAGVPRIMQAMLDDVIPRLQGGPAMLSRTVRCHLAEGVLAAQLGALQDRLPAIAIGSYPFGLPPAKPGTNLVLRGTDASALDAAVIELCAILRVLGGDAEVVSD